MGFAKLDKFYRSTANLWPWVTVLGLANAHCSTDAHDFSDGASGSSGSSAGAGDSDPSNGGDDNSGNAGGAGPIAGGSVATSGSGSVAGSDVGGAGNGGTTASAGSGGEPEPNVAGEGGGGPTGPVDTTAPEVVTVTPSGTGIAKDVSIAVTFSEPMQPSSSQAISLELDGQPVALNAGAWSGGGKTWTAKPQAELVYAVGANPNLPAKTYNVKVATAAKDLADNGLTAVVSKTFSTLRQIETVITTNAQRSYFEAESSYTNGASTSFYLRHQVGGATYEWQYDFGLVAFSKSDAALIAALPDAQTYALELYSQTALTGATIKVSHIDSANIESASTPYSTVKTTTTTVSNFGAANSWWTFDLKPIFTHASFNLASYSSLQILLELTAASNVEGTTKTVQFAGGTSASNVPRLRISKLVP